MLRSTEIYPCEDEQHPRLLRKMWVYALGAKAPSVGLRLNASKSESLLKRKDSSSGHTLTNGTRGTLCATKFCKIKIVLHCTISMEEDD